MRSHAVLVAVVGSVLGLCVGVAEAHSGISLQTIYLDNIDVAYRSTIRIVTDEPIEAIGNISITGGLVRQVGDQSIFAPVTYPFPGFDDYEPDTHLLITQDKFAEITGSPIIETNDYSLGSPDGFGTFEQGSDGMMTLLPEYQTTSMDFIQIVSPSWDTRLNVTVYTSNQTYQVHVSPWAMGVCGYYISPPDTDFGQVRVGTTATADVIKDHAGECWCYGSHEYTVNFPDAEGAFRLAAEDLSTSPDVGNYTFLPQMRGQTNCEAINDHWPAQGIISFSGCGVGPVFAADQTPGTTLEFGELEINSFFDVFTEVSNLTDDNELGDLTRLITHATIEGDAAGAFQLLDGDWCDLLVGQMDQLQLRFDATGLAAGEYEAVLVIPAMWVPSPARPIWAKSTLSHCMPLSCPSRQY